MQVLMSASPALQAVATISQGNAADKAARRNGGLLDEQASGTRLATVERENLTRASNARSLSGQRAALLANGVDPTSGSALIGVAQSAQDAEMDALTLRYEGFMQARNINMQANNIRYQGKAAKQQSRLTAASNLVSTAAGYLTGGMTGGKIGGIS